jgi:importin subunit alpha-1
LNQPTFIDEGRRNRHETLIKLRKDKKEQKLQRKRLEHSSWDTSDLKPDSGAGKNSFDNNSSAPSSWDDSKRKQAIDNFMIMCHTVHKASLSAEHVIEQVKIIRRLSIATNPPVKEIVESGALYFLVEFLKQQQNKTLIFEALWTLTNITATNYVAPVVAQDCVIDLLVQLLLNKEPEVREQAAWCMGNIAGDSIHFRDMILERPGALDGL